MTQQEIRELRGEMSTKEFGDLFMVSCRTVEGWEQGRKPRKSVLKKIKEMEKEKK